MARSTEASEQQILDACSTLGCKRSELVRIGKHANGETFETQDGVIYINAVKPDPQGRTGLMILRSPMRVSGPLAYFGEDAGTPAVIVIDDEVDEDPGGGPDAEQDDPAPEG